MRLPGTMNRFLASIALNIIVLLTIHSNGQETKDSNPGAELYYTADDGYAMLHRRGGGKKNPNPNPNSNSNRDCLDVTNSYDDDDIDRISSDIRPIVKRTISKYFDYMFDTGKKYSPRYPHCKQGIADGVKQRKTLEYTFLKLVKENLKDRKKFGSNVTLAHVRTALQRGLHNISKFLPIPSHEEEDPRIELLLLKAVEAQKIGRNSKRKGSRLHILKKDPMENVKMFKKAVKEGLEEEHAFALRTKKLKESYGLLKDNIDYMKAKLKKEKLTIERKKHDAIVRKKYIQNLQSHLRSHDSEVSGIENMRN